MWLLGPEVTHPVALAVPGVLHAHRTGAFKQHPAHEGPGLGREVGAAQRRVQIRTGRAPALACGRTRHWHGKLEGLQKGGSVLPLLCKLLHQVRLRPQTLPNGKPPTHPSIPRCRWEAPRTLSRMPERPGALTLRRRRGPLSSGSRALLWASVCPAVPRWTVREQALRYPHPQGQRP